jgi:hypothetical protein
MAHKPDRATSVGGMRERNARRNWSFFFNECGFAVCSFGQLSACIVRKR